MAVLARKKPLHFAFNPGKSAADHVLGLDKRKAPAIIGKAIKTSGQGVKVSFGLFEVDGKILMLTTENSLPAMAKKVKAFLKLNKVKLNVVVRDPNGAVLDQDIEDLPDDEAQSSAPADPPAVSAVEATAPQKLGLGLQAAVDKVSAAKASAPAPQQPKTDAPSLAALAQRLKALTGQIGAILDPDLKIQLTRDVKQIVGVVRAKDATSAAALLAELEVRLEAPKQAGTIKLLPRWQQARDAVDSQIAQLQEVLRGHGSSLFARISDKGLNGITRNHLVPLQAALMDFDRSAAQDREAVTKALRIALASMQRFLDQDSGVALLEANPLGVDVTLRQILGAVLEEISGELLI